MPKCSSLNKLSDGIFDLCIIMGFPLSDTFKNGEITH